MLGRNINAMARAFRVAADRSTKLSERSQAGKCWYMMRRVAFLSASVIDGKAIAAGILADVEKDVAALQTGFGTKGGTPTLAVVLVGQRPDSAKYVEMKKKAAKQVGFNSEEVLLPDDCSQSELLNVVSKLNARDEVDGILVQLPLPPQCDQSEILESISVSKDVDGFHPQNMGHLARMGEDLRHAKKSFEPLQTKNCSCTPLGSIVLLEKSGAEISGKHAVVLGRSNIVGLPAALMLLHRNATVTIAHSRTKNLENIIRSADILIAAIGIPEFVQGDWVKPGATIIDVGINFKPDSSKKSGMKMCGDVDFDAASKVAGAITPVPGGVGPMTVAMLMVNTLNNAKYRLERRNQSRENLLPQHSKERIDDKGDDGRSPAQLIRRKSQTVNWKYGTSANEPH